MILFPNAKINIGLYITEKRSDGFHNIETVFHPIGLSDILEIKLLPEGGSGKCTLKTSGTDISCPPGKNLVEKAYRLLADEHEIPSVRIHLHKMIPSGAGLGGGSSDAAFTLKGLNDMFSLGLDVAALESYAARLGSDCPFFINDRTVFAHGKGEIMEDLQLDLEAFTIRCEKPDCFISTQEAYSCIVPKKAPVNLRDLKDIPVEQWKETVYNDFEPGAMKQFPEIAALKRKMYEEGALYVSMSGSGAAVYGIFRK